MNYIVYKTTNLVNGKYYIGAHRLYSSSDEYLGSGTLLKKAIKKHGRKNFIREILFRFNTEEEMYQKEKEIVNKDFISLDETYNIVPGGKGGKSYKLLSKETKDKISKSVSKILLGRPVSTETRNKISKAHIGKKLSDETKRKISIATRGIKTGPMTNERKLNISNALKGRKMTDEQCSKLSTSLTGRTLSDNHKANIAKASKGRVYPLADPCPHCNKIVRKGCYTRWHGDNCKMRKTV